MVKVKGLRDISMFKENYVLPRPDGFMVDAVVCDLKDDHNCRLYPRDFPMSISLTIFHHPGVHTEGKLPQN